MANVGFAPIHVFYCPHFILSVLLFDFDTLSASAHNPSNWFIDKLKEEGGSHLTENTSLTEKYISN